MNTHLKSLALVVLGGLVGSPVWAQPTGSQVEQKGERVERRG